MTGADWRHVVTVDG